MKSLFTALLVAGGIAVTAQATPWTITQTQLAGDNTWFYLTSNTPYSNTFNIKNPPAGSVTVGSPLYNPLTMKVTAATVQFAFADDQWDTTRNSDNNPDTGTGSDGYEYVTIKLDGFSWVTNEEVDGSYTWPENHALWDWVSGGLTGTILASLQDGILSYKVTVANSGDLYLKETKLIATVDYKVVSVPDSGATVALLGLGLLTIAAIKRRR